MSPLCTETKECLLYTPVCQAEEYEVSENGAISFSEREKKMSEKTVMLMKACTCPPPRVLQVRALNSTKWVTTEETSPVMEMATYTAFKRLYKYITGANENGVFVCVCVRELE